MSFIFGGNTGNTYEDIQRRRKIAQSMIAPKPRNAGEGLLAIADALVSRGIERKADKAEQKLKDQFSEQFGQVAPQAQSMADLYSNPYASDAQKRILGALMGKAGVPGFSRGGTMKKPGLAVVGEAGPELVELPGGAEVSPFNDAASYQTADMSDIEVAGLGEQGKLNAAARSFQGFMKSLDDYEKTFANGGSTMWPGPRRDELGIAHRDLQMQMKELYNLGVLNGPDLDLMNQILIDPTSVGGNVMDALGVADMEERIPANIRQVRQLMLNRTEPALQQLGVDPASLMPQRPASELSDEELLKALGQ